MARKEYRGAAGQLTLAAGIAADEMTFVCDGLTAGWPTGTDWPFIAVIDAGNAAEEKILVTNLSGSTFNVAERGYDGTAASTHSIGATIQHRLDAESLTDFAAHVYDTSRDDHEQYVRTDGSRLFDDVDLVVDVPVSVGTANADGTSDKLARSDHVHDIADGAIDSAAKFAAGVVDAAAIAANAVGVSELADNAVDTPAIAADAVTAAKIADGAVGHSEVADGSLQVSDIATYHKARIFSTGVTGGPVGAGAVGLATLSIANLGVAYSLDVSAFWTCLNSTLNDQCTFQIYVDGVLKAEIQNRHSGGANERRSYSIPNIPVVEIPSGSGTTIQVIAQRSSGAGTFTETVAGTVTAKVYPHE